MSQFFASAQALRGADRQRISRPQIDPQAYLTYTRMTYVAWYIKYRNGILET